LNADRQEGRLVRTELDEPRWRELVANDPHALPFHHPAWAQMLAECYGFRAFGLALTDPGGRLIGGIPVVETGGRLRGRQWISLPFTDFCAPLVAGDSGLQVRLERELDAARLAAGVRSVELRSPPAGQEAVAGWTGFRHVLRLDPDPDAMFSRFKREVRKAIRLAERSGVTVAQAAEEEDLTRTFYGLQTATRRRLGVPVQPRQYFSALWRRVVEPGLGFLLVARKSGRPVAAAVFLAWRGTVVAKYGASDAGAWSVRPNNAVYWHAIRWACENGYSRLDFGRTDAEDEGLRIFKRRWGAAEVPLTYAVIGNANASRSGAGRALRLAKPFIRHAPLFVCQGIGTAFYRFGA
jgi:CelD/BcsL family acetyltransferase involved in cellulose biosynthesis